MSNFAKIAYCDLKLEAAAGRLQKLIGRKVEALKLSRVLSRQLHNNCLIIGESGIGKTQLVRGWAELNAKNLQYKNFAFVELNVESFYQLNASAASQQMLERFEQALSILPACVLFLDNFGALAYNKPQVLQNLSGLVKPLLLRRDVGVVLCATESEAKFLETQEPALCRDLEQLKVESQPENERLEILQNALKHFRTKYGLWADAEILRAILDYQARFHSLGQTPRVSIRLLDESLALTKILGLQKLELSQIAAVAADKTGVPLEQLLAKETKLLKNLKKDLARRIVGQDAALNVLANILQRAKLGLKNPNRPLSSFLLLGPSGVGKTETAKLLAEIIFGRRQNFTRLDMSEFGEAHTVQRLLGAPAGYVGYDAGGGLTNPIKRNPHSLLLLDEVEKAHSKIFDIFLQVLDDGRLTSGQGETVDFTQTIIMATSNLAVAEIIEGCRTGEDVNGEGFLRKKIMPALKQAFRTEFLNRFDAIVVFKPLGADELLKIAQLEIAKIQERVKRHRLKFQITQSVLRKRVAELADPSLGARPVKRFVEETCESLIAKALLN